MLIDAGDYSDNALLTSILESLTEKAQSRNITVTRDSLSDSAVRERAMNEYNQLEAEIVGDLPPFDDTFAAVCNLYDQLPWPTAA